MNSWHTNGRKKSRSRKSRPSPLATHSLQVVDACLWGILFIAPLFFGGRHLLGRFVLVTLACVAGVAWFVHQGAVKQANWTRTWANVVAVGALVLVSAQLLPLPAAWLESLAPRNTELLSLWSGPHNDTPQLGNWTTLSLTPPATKIALATLVAYVLLFITATGRLRTLDEIQSLLQYVAIAVVFMGGFGILQYLTSNGKFFWFYEYPYTTTAQAAKGSFTTRNHFAHFLALGIGPLLAWIVLRLKNFDHTSTPRLGTNYFRANLTPVLLHGSLGIVVLAVLLSLSRGGILAMLVATTVTVAIFYRHRLLSGSYLYGLAMLGLLVIGLLSLSDYDRVAHRLDDITSGSLEVLDGNDGRRKIWQANLGAIASGAFFGSGAGSHREIYPIYLAQSPLKEYTHAENGYLQIATENGWLGLSLLGIVLATVVRWCWIAIRGARSTQSVALAGAILASLAVSLAQSLVDFVWFIPSCMSLTILLGACALRLAQITQAENCPTSTTAVLLSRTHWFGMAATCACASAWAISTLLGPAMASTHWDKFLLTASHTAQLSEPEDLPLEHPSGVAVDQESRTEAMIYHLLHVLRADPQFARAHLRLASKYMQLFNQRQMLSANAMSIDQVRDAAIASKFSSSKELRAWLLQAFGDNSRLLYQAHYHARQALLLGPLQGEGYLYLANLCFLQGQSNDAIGAYLDQATNVRPYNGEVLFETGRQRLLLGQFDQAFASWQRILRDQGSHQRKIIHMLVGNLPAEVFLQLFEPDWQTVPLVWQQYRVLGNEQDWNHLVEYATQVAMTDLSDNAYHSASAHHALAEILRELDRTDEALPYFEQAAQLMPNHYVFRRALGRAYLQLGQYRLAESHLRWCLARTPDLASLRSELIQSKKHQLPQNAASQAIDYH